MLFFEVIVLILPKNIYVSKGEDDIRLVYTFTALIMNNFLCVPTFYMLLLDNVIALATH